MNTLSSTPTDDGMTVTLKDKETEESLHNDGPEDTGDGKLQDLEKAPTQEDDSPPYSIFTTWQKRSIALGAACMAIFSPLSSQIYLPALPTVASDLDVSITQINLTVTCYMIVQAIAPMLIGSLADSSGRRPAYLLCLVIYIAANIGLALAPNYGAVVALRCIQSAGSSPAIALCSAVMADIATSGERGTYIAFSVLPAVLGPALGPVVGGFLSDKMGWRSIFWFLTILAVVAAILHLLFFPETCRLVVDNGSVPPPSSYRTLPQIISLRKEKSKSSTSDLTPAQTAGSALKFKFKPPNIVGSLMMLAQKETGTLLGTSSLTYAGFYATATAMPAQYTERYGMNEWQVGLMFLPLAVGSIIAASIAGPVMNWNYRRHCARLGIPFDRKKQQDLTEFPIEKVRMQVGLPMLAFGGAGLVVWGWAMQASAHLAIMAILAVVMCMGMVGFNNTINVLLVDIHPGKPGAATAANNLTRCLLGAGSTAVIQPMMDAIGVGWSFTIMGAFYIICAPFLVLVMRRGMQWRTELREKHSATG